MKQVVKRMVTAVRSFYDLVKDPTQQTYYPEEERKGGFRIFCENVVWLLKYREINHSYYVYGFDRVKPIPRNTFIAKRKFFTAQAVANGPVSMNGRKIFYGCLLQDKFIFSRYLKSLNLPAPEILGLGQKDSIYWLDEAKQEPLESIRGKGDRDVFVKPILGALGEGVFMLKIRNGCLQVDGREIDLFKLKQLLSERYIIQERIKQHPKLSELCTDTVASIRMITALKKGKPEYITSRLIIGTGRNTMSNWAAGGLSVGVDPETGQLCPYAFFKPGFGGKIKKHPDTGVAFDGFTVPYFKEAVDLVLRTHGYFYGTHSIGWDMAISESGPVFIEGNNLWGMGSLQIDDPLFVQNYLASLPEVKGGQKSLSMRKAEV